MSSQSTCVYTLLSINTCLSSYLNGLNGFEYFESVEEMQRDKL